MPEPVDNTDAISWKDLKSREFSLDLRSYVQTTNQEVPHATAPTTIASGVFDARVVNDPPDVHKSRKLTTTQTAASTVVDKKNNGAWGELQRFAAEYTVTKSMKTAATLGAHGFLIVVEDLNEHNPSNWKSDIISVSSWQTLTRYEWDEQLGLLLTIVESVVATETAVPASTKTVFVEQRQVDDQRDIRTTISLPSTFDRTTTENIQYTFPGLFRGYLSSATLINPQGRTYFEFIPDVRPPFGALPQAQVRDNLVTAAELAVLLVSTPTLLGTDSLMADVFYPIPTDINHNGLLVKIDIPNVLTDWYEGVGEPEPGADFESILATTNSADVFYGGAVVDQIVIRPSIPTYLEYQAMVDSEDYFCVQDNIKPWKYGLFWRQRVMIKMQ